MSENLRVILSSVGAVIQSAIDRGERVRFDIGIDVIDGDVRQSYRLGETRTRALDRPGSFVVPSQP